MKSAFTLIEITVAVIIISILAAMALPQLNKAVETTKAKEAVAALQQIRTGERTYRLGRGYYYPHFTAHPGPEEDEAEINRILRLFLDTREVDWRYKIDTGDTADVFDAVATRTRGNNEGDTITIDQGGTIDKTGWSP